ncbi:uncharacterized protein LOC121790595 [Salvia splendens]|uniref:uncharacterized protein LOC121790595 n=1 Tax=Salvia splendens TaxID=180675 RepID=UPI0010FFEAD4|nr:uncharacterized protein LOC121790595 [Salvia splendens]
MLVGEDLGIFLAQFRWLWERAHPFGVTHHDGIQRLIRLLPSDWVGFAIDRSRDYIFPAAPLFDPHGDFPEFIGEIHSCFILHGQAPRGPYMRPGDLAPVGDPGVPQPADLQPEPVTPQPDLILPPLPSPPRHRARGEFEAGPSCPPLGEEEDPYPASLDPAPSLEGVGSASTEARELRAAAAERRRRGNAPATLSDEDESVEQKIIVGTSRLQPLPIPSETSPDTLLGAMIPTIPSHHESISLERGPVAWAIRHWGAVTRGPHPPGSTIESAILLDESSDEEEPEEDEGDPGTGASTIATPA